MRVYGTSGARRPHLAITAAAVVGTVLVGVLLALPWIAGRPAERTEQAADPYVVEVPVAPSRAPAGTGPPPLRRMVPPASGGYLGIFAPELVAEQAGIRSWTSAHGVRPRVVSWFQQWASGERRFRADWVAAVADSGAVPMITWEPWRKEVGARQRWVQPDIAPRAIASGRYDDYIRAWARAAARHRGPILIRLMHEMNGFWYPWAARENGNTPAEYVAAWRHVVRIFRAQGARNVGFVWSINNLEGAAGERERLRDYYPGDAYVDWVGTSGFNWGDAYDWSGWRSPAAIFAATYRRLAAFDKPVIFTEVGTVQGGGDSAAWVRDAVRAFRTYPRLAAVVWYDHVDADGNDFRLTPGQARALRAGGAWYRVPQAERVPDRPRARGPAASRRP